MEIILLEDPATTMLGIYPKDAPHITSTHGSTMVIAVLLIIARSLKEPRCPSTEEWIQKMWYIYTMDIINDEFMKFVGKWMESSRVS